MAGKGKGVLSKQKLTRLIIAVSGAILLGCCLYFGVSNYADGKLVTPEDGQVKAVAFEPAKIDVIAFDAAETPAPTPLPDIPATAVDIVVNGQAVISVSDEAAAKALLTKLLNINAAAPEGERFLSAAYECDIRFLPATGYTPFYDFDTAFNLLFSEPTLVPVTVRTERMEVSTAQAAASSETNAALYKGARRILQLGAGARTIARTELTYVGDEALSTGEPQSSVVMDARATIVENGSFKTDNGDKDAGKAGKDAGGLKLYYPMRGSVNRYFGVDGGNMHAGIDIEAKKGTNVIAPAEGVVTYCAERGEYGFTVDIDHGDGFLSRLTHLSDVSVELNQRVFSGNAVGKLSGDVAEGDKPCLHYELLIDGVPYNPLFYLKS